MPNIGAPELLLVLAIVILIFGASRIPKLGRSMGQSIRGFKQGLKEDVVEEDGMFEIRIPTLRPTVYAYKSQIVNVYKAGK